jgi:hypothetical protein
LDNTYSEKLRTYYASPEWMNKKLANRERNAMENGGLNRCDHCHTTCGPFQTHHKGKRGEAYQHLGNEPLNTLQLLCIDCHEVADERRRMGLSPLEPLPMSISDIEEDAFRERCQQDRMGLPEPTVTRMSFIKLTPEQQAEYMRREKQFNEDLTKGM